jgi:iron complex outermembrane receptor protein
VPVLVLPLKFRRKRYLTADAYIVRIDDRVTLTDQFSRPSGTFAAGTPQRELQLQFDLAGANAATFCQCY